MLAPKETRLQTLHLGDSPGLIVISSRAAGGGFVDPLLVMFFLYRESVRLYVCANLVLGTIYPQDRGCGHVPNALRASAIGAYAKRQSQRRNTIIPPRPELDRNFERVLDHSIHLNCTIRRQRAQPAASRMG